MNKEKIYKIDSTGKTRVWWLEYDDEKYRSHSGILDGAIVESGWIYPEEKNVGKANATSIAEQVLSEIESKYEKQLFQGKYAETVEEARLGPKFVDPMLAKKYDAKKDTKFPYFSQPKLDGIRCLTFELDMQTRKGKPLVSSPHIRDELEDFYMEYPDFTLDGELYNHDLKDDFEKIISLARKTKPTDENIAESAQMVEYHVYDVITPEPMTYQERHEFLMDNIDGKYKMIKVVPVHVVMSEEEISERLVEYLEDGYEGGMLRDTITPYENKRSASLKKHKTFLDGEYKILDIQEGVGNWAGRAKRVVIELENGDTQATGVKGTYAFTKKILENKEDYIGGDVTVEYQDRTGTRSEEQRLNSSH